jgi:hypothetical protein
MKNQYVNVRACYVATSEVTFSPGWPIPNDPEQNQAIEILDSRTNKTVIVTLREKEILIEVYNTDEEGALIDRELTIKHNVVGPDIRLPLEAPTVTLNTGETSYETAAPKEEPKCCGSGCCKGPEKDPEPKKEDSTVKNFLGFFGLKPEVIDSMEAALDSLMTLGAEKAFTADVVNKHRTEIAKLYQVCHIDPYSDEDKYRYWCRAYPTQKWQTGVSKGTLISIAEAQWLKEQFPDDFNC